MRHVSVKPPICSNPRQTLGSESKCTTSAAGNGDNSIMMWQKKLALTISLVGLQVRGSSFTHRLIKAQRIDRMDH